MTSRSRFVAQVMLVPQSGGGTIAQWLEWGTSLVVRNRNHFSKGLLALLVLAPAVAGKALHDIDNLRTGRMLDHKTCGAGVKPNKLHFTVSPHRLLILGEAAFRSQGRRTGIRSARPGATAAHLGFDFVDGENI